jgi:hypothetical protein
MSWKSLPIWINDNTLDEFSAILFDNYGKSQMIEKSAPKNY